jgi:phosphosulfolactate phosphohydrolase-like enzyme
MKKKLLFSFVMLFVFIMGIVFVNKAFAVDSPTITSSAINTATKTVTYTFSEPIQFIKQADSTVTTNPAGLVKIYTALSYSSRNIGDPEPAAFGGTNIATLVGAVLTINYATTLPANSYLADTWGYTVTDLEGNTLVESLNGIFTPDTTLPTAVASHVQSTKTIIYTFSEDVQLINQADDRPTPVAPSLLGIHAVDNLGNYVNTKVGSIDTVTLNDNVLTITYSGDLPEGNYIVDAWGYDITDMVGNIIAKNDQNQVFKSDTTLPTVFSASQVVSTKTITYTFSEDMKLVSQASGLDTTFDKGLIGIYLIDPLTGDYTNTPVVTILNATLAGTVLTITYEGNIPTGTYIVDAWGYNITDIAGNRIAKGLALIPSQTFTVDPDTTLPTATVTQSGQTITYTFSEPMKLTNNDGSAIAGTIAEKLAVYSVTDLNYGTATVVPGIFITDAKLVGNILTITYAGSLVAQVNSKYVVDAWGYKISDLAGNKMASDISQMFDVTGVDTIPPTLNIAGFTSNSIEMTSSIAGGYTLNTDGNANTKYKVQFAANSVALENLKDETVGLFLQPTTDQTAALIEYYSTNPAQYKTYLNGAAAGSQPFALIKTNGTTIQLLDGAMKALASIETDMVVPGDAPSGIYTLKGTIHDLAGNSTEVAYILNVVIPTNLDAYNAVLSAVKMSDYTTISWTAYQVVVTANVKTSANSQTEVDAATANITTAQHSLITVLTAAKSAAVSELAAYKNSANYRTAEQTTLATAITNGNTAINGAANTGAVTTALSDAKLVINAIKTNAQLTAEELSAAKVLAVSQLAAYKNSADYRTEEQTTLATAITNGNTAINGAANTDAVATALSNAKGVIDAIKTDNQLIIEELAAAKAAEGLLVRVDYVSYDAVTAALTLPEASNAEKIEKAAALNGAISGLVAVSSIFSPISKALTSANIANNLNTVVGSNWKTFAGLYFEKSVDGVKMGKITFTKELDLSKTENKTFLQNLGSKLDMSAGHIALDARTAADLKNAGASIEIYTLPQGLDMSKISLTITDEIGNVLDGGIATNTRYQSLGMCEVGGICTIFSFGASHFTSFDLKVVETTQTVPDSNGNVTLTSDKPEVVVTDPSKAITVESGSISNTTVDVGTLINLGTGDIPQITINSDLADVSIPATKITSTDATWNGVIAAPTVTTIALPNLSGETRTLSTAIEVGFSGAKLSFDKAVRILLPNQAGKRAGYTRTGTAFTEITNVCASDSQATGDTLAVDGDCKINVGSDLVIWTKHFTSFATYTQTANRIGSYGGSSTISNSNTNANTNTNTQNIEKLQALINQLQEQIKAKKAAQGEVLGASDSVIVNTHKKGSRGNEVVVLQEKLRSLGFFTFATNTGFFGSITEDAVKAFQKSRNITPTGFVGPLTLAELNK